MDGDTIIMNPNSGKSFKMLEEEVLQQEQQITSQPNNLTQEGGRESRYSAFHRRRHSSRGEVEFDTSTTPPTSVDTSAVGDVLASATYPERISYLFMFLGRFCFFLFQFGVAAFEILFTIACNPRLWNVAWIAASATAEILIYLVLALSTVFVAVIINIYEGSRKDGVVENDIIRPRTAVPKGACLGSFSK